MPKQTGLLGQLSDVRKDIRECGYTETDTINVPPAKGGIRIERYWSTEKGGSVVIYLAYEKRFLIYFEVLKAVYRSDMMPASIINSI